jgi:hypothetical protein
MRRTVRFAVDSPLHTAVFSIVTPYPGSRLDAGPGPLRNELSFSTVGKIVRNLSGVADERLAAIRIRAYRKFYFSPGRWWALFRGVSNKQALLRNFVEVVRVAFFKKELFG